jgi:integrase
MPRQAQELKAAAVGKLTAPGLHFVGGVPGLALQVKGPARSWVLRLVVGAARRDMGLGPYPEVALALARDKARLAREQVRRGVDPIAQAQAQRSHHRQALRPAVAVTFEHCAQAYISAHRKTWSPKHAQQWDNTLAQHAYPLIGEMPVGEVGLAQVLAVVEPIWHTTTETASRLRARIELVLDWATASKHRSGENPARWKGHLDKLLPEPGKLAPVAHHEAVPVGEAAEFMARLRRAEGTAARALEFLLLTAGRSDEIRGATWAEIGKTDWTVPAARMKARKEHRVALSDAAQQLLAGLPTYLPTLGGDRLVFPAARGRALTDKALTKVMRDLGQAVAVPHGLRSTFRDWAGEETDYPSELAEMALAHKVGDKVEEAYRRGSGLKRRRALMQDWAGFLRAASP